MTRTTIGVATAALLALAGCGETDQAGNRAGPANESAPANAASAGPAPAGTTDSNQTGSDSGGAGASATASSSTGEIRALLIGRWAEDGDCVAATDIRQDGTFSSPAGQGRWTLENEYLDLTGAGPTISMAVQEIDRSEMTTINPQGRIGRWTRC